MKERWEAYDLNNSDTLAEHSGTLKELLSIAIVTPTGGGLGAQNTSYINKLNAAGIEITRLAMPGTHVTQRAERFIAMAEVILGQW